MPDIVYQISCLGSEDKNMDSVKNLSWENQLGLEKKGSINMFRKVRKERRNSVQAYGRKTRQKKTADYGREISPLSDPMLRQISGAVGNSNMPRRRRNNNKDRFLADRDVESVLNAIDKLSNNQQTKSKFEHN